MLKSWVRFLGEGERKEYRRDNCQASSEGTLLTDAYLKVVRLVPVWLCKFFPRHCENGKRNVGEKDSVKNHSIVLVPISNIFSLIDIVKDVSSLNGKEFDVELWHPYF